MTNQEKFNDTISILVKAYLNDTLEHCNCHACAVGNIIASKMGISITEGRYGMVWPTGNDPVWFDAIWIDEVLSSKITPKIKEQYESTGYTGSELARIEYAFEHCEAGDSDDGYDSLDPEYMFNGLMAVLDVLAEIHGISLQQKESAKLMFVK